MDDVDALAPYALCERRGQLGPRFAHVVRDRPARGAATKRANTLPIARVMVASS